MIANLMSFLAVAALVFVVLCVLLYWRQESFIFFPQTTDPLLARKFEANRVRIQSQDEVLEGWWVENTRTNSPAVILYFGGNAEDVLFTATTAPLFDAQRMLVVNYRGYGRSSGKAGEKALYTDALAVYDYALRTPGVDPAQLIVVGRSLGAAVAAKLASERPVAGAILVTPFDSLAAVAARHYRFFPVRLLLRHSFDSADCARRTQAPTLILAGQNDAIIPATHAQNLHAAWAGPKQIHVLDDVGHNNIEQHAQYYPLINEFIHLNSGAR